MKHIFNFELSINYSLVEIYKGTKHKVQYPVSKLISFTCYLLIIDNLLITVNTNELTFHNTCACGRGERETEKEREEKEENETEKREIKDKLCQMNLYQKRYG